jgi:hypothetical protein
MRHPRGGASCHVLKRSPSRPSSTSKCSRCGRCSKRDSGRAVGGGPARQAPPRQQHDEDTTAELGQTQAKLAKVGFLGGGLPCNSWGGDATFLLQVPSEARDRTEVMLKKHRGLMERINTS